MAAATQRPILILGGGINGAAIAREFLLNGVSVCLVDAADLASGTTAYSSRLIHGGLRYLEYGEFGLVRESLAERARLLRLAPDYVRPLRLFIPVASRCSGWGQSLARFCGVSRPASRPVPRGLWLVGAGLALYDTFARDPLLPGRSVHRVNAADVPPVNPRFRWLHAYSDAQMVFPERFVVALLDDARQLAEEKQQSFEVHPYHRAQWRGDRIELRQSAGRAEVSGVVEPAAIVNATGPWIDATLRDLQTSHRRLIGGTKGSHLLTFHEGLRDMLSGRGIYTEAADGRPIFVLPWRDGTLIGTTDIPSEGDPADVTTSEAEIAYLLAAVNDVFPDAALRREDVTLHSAGVRPLPYVDRATPAAVTRRHWLESHSSGPVPLFSLVGGKLTTCRSLAEQTVATVLSRLGQRPFADSRDRRIPSVPCEGDVGNDVELLQRQFAERSGWSRAQIQAVWELCGSRAMTMLPAAPTAGPARAIEQANIPGTCLPRGFVRNLIRREWVTRLADLVERRLMLVYDQRLMVAAMEALAELMVQEGRLGGESAAAEVRACRQRLESHYGRRVADGELK